MIERKLIPIGFIAVVLAAVVAITQSAYCQEGGYYSLMIQQSPVDAGFGSPGVGIHRVPIGEHVTLTATPKPGYRFVYWMGNVSDPSASEAIVVMDAPKIVVAVFERAEHEPELLIGGGGFAGGQGGGGGLVGIGADYSRGGSVSAGGYREPSKRRFILPDYVIVDESDDFPVPGEGDSIPVPGKDNPVPEPATVVILGAGGLMLLGRKRR
ncbi:MAG: PEP-CTERM sorting domain-containing protein [Planctomycetes bacterium]|nr:PEP-CTERM sorting domain-containing protein [Planctomycetota bacterium]